MPTLIEALNRKHPEYLDGVDRWIRLDSIVEGGARLTDPIKRQILVNPDGRPQKIIDERLKVASYVNKISPILTRFNAQLFEVEGSYEGSKDKFWEDVFLKEGGRLPCDDDSRASFHQFLRESMFRALAVGKAIAQVDVPIASGADNRAAQRELGEDRPVVNLWPRTALWDWRSGADGFVFAKLHKFVVDRPRWDADPVPMHDFTCYQRERDGTVTVSRYLVREKLKENETPAMREFSLAGKRMDDVEIETVVERQPVFNVGGKFRFPVLTLTLPTTLHLADQLYDLQASHFNATAGIQWKLQASNFAMPVVVGGSTDDDEAIGSQKFGDGYMLRLPSGYSIQTFDHGGGGAVSVAIEYRKEIAQDIRDVLYQIALSAADGAAVVARSAQSKKEDRRPEQILLETYGVFIREYAKQILDAASIAFGEDVEWTVNGFDDFLGEGLLEDIQEQTSLDALVIPSETFKRESKKNFVRRYASAYRMKKDKLDESLKEIDTAPKEELSPPQPASPGGPPDVEARNDGNADGGEAGGGQRPDQNPENQNGGADQEAPPAIPKGKRRRNQKDGGGQNEAG